MIFSPRTLLLRLGALSALVLLAMVIATSVGAITLSPGDMIEGLTHALTSERAPSMHASVFWIIRAPRVLVSALVGATLGVSGAALQGIFRNPMADPGLIGVSSGAATAVVCMIVFGAWAGFKPGLWSLPTAAFVGALGATLLVLRLSMRQGRVEMATMLLVGLALNALAGSILGFATYMATDAQLRSLTLWSLGSLSGSTWTQAGVIALLALPGMAALLLSARALDLLLLGEREARHLGVEVGRTRALIIVCSALSVGVGVGFTGIIGFVGLMVPHLIRLLGGASHRWVLAGSMLGGALLLVLADTLARTLAAPAELPIGVLTSALGAPFFLGLLAHRRQV